MHNWNPTFRTGVVAAPRRASALAGVEMLRRGGNAVDAVVAAALADCVVGMGSSCFGGYGGAMLIYDARKRRAVTVDYNTRAPARFDAATYTRVVGGRAQRQWAPLGALLRELGWNPYDQVTVPAILAGLAHALESHGTKSWQQAFKPALRLALDGVPVDVELRQALAGTRDLIRADERLLQELMPHGRLPEVGEQLPAPRFAATAEALYAEGPDVFYSGRFGKIIGDWVRAQGGSLELADLAEYQPRELPPLSIRYRGYEVLTAPLAHGGLSVLQILRLLEGLEGQSPATDEPALLELLAKASRLAWQDRLTRLGDPACCGVDPALLLSERYAGQRVRAGSEAHAGPSFRSDAKGTIHISVADSQGNLAALTQTKGGGTTYVPELGLHLNRGLVLFDPRAGTPNAPAPRKQPLTNMCPVLILKDGAPLFALGAPGARTIVSAVSQILVGLLRSGLGLAEALETPRFHCEAVGPFLVEPGVPQAFRDRLAARGEEVRVQQPIAGPAHAVARSPHALEGAADPRYPDSSVGGV